MELTYLVRGADGKQYGPVTLDQLGGWIREGRLLAEQEIQRSDMNYWAAAGAFSELQPVYNSLGPAPAPAAAAATPGPARPATKAAKDPAAAAVMKSGASWFYWIAGLSLINSISSASGSDWRFILGLGITQFIDAFGHAMGGGGAIIALLLDVMAAGVCVLFGVFAHKAHGWAFVTGMILFALDGVIFLLCQDWLGVGFHVFALYCLFRGYRACRSLKAG